MKVYVSFMVFVRIQMRKSCGRNEFVV